MQEVFLMDRGRMFEIADLVKRNRARYKFEEQPEEQLVAESTGSPEIVEDTCTEPEMDEDIEEPSDNLPASKESQLEPLIESVCPDKIVPTQCNCKHDIVEALIDNAHKLNLGGKNASIAFTLIRLLKMDSDNPESQKDLAETTGQAVSTIERHIKFLKENGFIETELITDKNGSKTIYRFNGVHDKLKSLGIDI